MPNKLNFIEYPEQDERPSRFLVDLPSHVSFGDEAGGEAPKRPRDFMERYIDARHKLIHRYHQNRRVLSRLFRESRGQIKEEAGIRVDLAAGVRRASRLMNGTRRLFVYPFLKILFIFFSYLLKTAARVGWAVLFCALFAYKIKRHLLAQKHAKLEKEAAAEPKPANGPAPKRPALKFNMDFNLDFFATWADAARIKFYELKQKTRRRPAKVRFQRVYDSDLERFKLRLLEYRMKYHPASIIHDLFTVRFYARLFFIFLLIVLPFKLFSFYNHMTFLRGSILGVAQSAAGEIMEAGSALGDGDFATAQKNFSAARSDFLAAREQIEDLNVLLGALSLMPDREMKMAGQADLLIEAGILSAEIGRQMSELLAVFDRVNNEAGDIAELIDALDEKSRFILPQTLELAEIAGRIDPEGLPAEYAEQFKAVKTRSSALKTRLKSLAAWIDDLKIAFGMERDARYLFVFQNNAEMRGSGGFMGSYALVDISRGQIRRIETPGGGTYDTEAGMLDNITAPEPLHLLNPRWYFWDSNWWPDWPTTAKKIQWFYEKSGGSTVDGVIAMTPTLLEEALKVIGPIDMAEKYNVVVNHGNFWEITQTFSEQKDETHPDYVPNPFVDDATTTAELAQKPKKMIGDLMRRVIEEAGRDLGKVKLLKLSRVLEEQARRKQVLFYFNEDRLQSRVEDLAWSGRQLETGKDYLMVANSNIGGGKSDRSIRQEIYLQTEIRDNGDVYNNLTVKRIHEGSKSERFSGVRNVNWLRVYVPEGSELISSGGWRFPDSKYFEEPEDFWVADEYIASTEGLAETDPDTQTKIYIENGKTVFANWTMTDPGQISVIYIKYKLPFRIKIEEESAPDKIWDKILAYLRPRQKNLAPYSILMQKQPGSLNVAYSQNISLAPKFRTIWQKGENLSSTGRGWSLNGELETDKLAAFIFELD